MDRPQQFQLSGNAAELYEQYAVPYILAPWAPALVESAALQPGERVLDLACGTGVVARLTASVVGPTGAVTGADLNAGMLAVARSLPPPSGATIAWIEGSASALPLPDGSFDVILCQQGFQFFPDKPAALREMRRLLGPGGRMRLSVWRAASPYHLAVTEALDRHVSAEAARMFLASRVVPDAAALHRLVVDAEFRDVEVLPRTLTKRLPPPEDFVLHHLAGTPVASMLTAVGPEARAAVARHVAAALRPYADGDGVMLPDEINMVVAHR